MSRPQHLDGQDMQLKVCFRLLVREIGADHSLYDKSMKLCTLIEHDIRNVFGYRAIHYLTFDPDSSLFFNFFKILLFSTWQSHLNAYIHQLQLSELINGVRL